MCALALCLLMMTGVWALPEKKTDFWTKTGDVVQIALPVSTALSLYWEGDTLELERYLWATGATVLQTQVLKYAIAAPRPYGGKYSFPSGHTSFVFSSPSFVLLRQGVGRALPTLALASFVGWSRVYGKYHYVRDVVAGAGLAFLNQALFYRYYGLSLAPLPRGVALRYRA